MPSKYQQVVWTNNLNKLKMFIDKNQRLPSCSALDNDEVVSCSWMYKQTETYKKRMYAMANPETYELWTKFTADYPLYANTIGRYRATNRSIGIPPSSKEEQELDNFDVDMNLFDSNMGGKRRRKSRRRQRLRRQRRRHGKSRKNNRR